MYFEGGNRGAFLPRLRITIRLVRARDRCSEMEICFGSINRCERFRSATAWVRNQCFYSPRAALTPGCERELSRAWNERVENVTVETTLAKPATTPSAFWQGAGKRIEVKKS